MTKKIGIMQGRLLPKHKGRYQAHPLGYWQDEFILAKKLDLDLIEFIFDYNDYTLNPLMSVSGIEKIQRHINETGVNGGKMDDLSTVIRVPSAKTEKIQECHIMIGHIVCHLIESNLFNKK